MQTPHSLKAKSESFHSTSLDVNKVQCIFFSSTKLEMLESQQTVIIFARLKLPLMIKKNRLGCAVC